MQKIRFLVGLPGTGKSTVSENLGGNDKNYIINRDNVVDSVCSEFGLNYSETFLTPNENSKIGDIEEGMEKYGIVIEIEKPSFMQKNENDKTMLSFSNISKIREKINIDFQNLISNSSKQDKPIIVDMTMLSISEREDMIKKIKIGNLNKNFDFSVILFETPSLKIFKGLTEDNKQLKIKELQNNFSYENYGVFQNHKDIMELRNKYLIENGLPSKEIPISVFLSLSSRFEMPTKEEGFSNIRIEKPNLSKFVQNLQSKIEGSLEVRDFVVKK